MMKNANICSTIALFATLLAVPSVLPDRAQAAGYLADYHAYVISVESWDRLNMRRWPASHSQKVGSIPHHGTNIYVQRCIVKSGSSDWCKVNYRGNWGWVSKRFLAAE